MMKRFLFTISGFIILLSAKPAESLAFIYDAARSITGFEFMIDGYIDDFLVNFITHQRVFPMPEHQQKLSSEDVFDALRYRPDLICARREKKGSICNIAQPVRTIARREAFSRTVGRDLQLTAAANEMPLTDHTGQPVMIAPRAPSIIRIWQSSFDWMFTPIIERRVRSHHLPDKEDEEFLKIMEGEKDQNGNRQGGIKGSMDFQDIWRYRWGLRTVEREGPQLKDCIEDWWPAWQEEIYDGSELILLKKRNCILEEKMEKALEYVGGLVSRNPDFRLEHGETVIFPIYEFDYGGGSQDAGVFVWFRIEGISEAEDGEESKGGEEEQELEIKGDVGLGVKKPFSPFLPQYGCEWGINDHIVPACVPGIPGDDCDKIGAGELPPEEESQLKEMCKNGIILGGMYPDPPPEPPEGEKLCSQVFSSKGYLCDFIETRDCMEEKVGEDKKEEKEGTKKKDEKEEKNTAGIRLTTCNPSGMGKDTIISRMESGPDACQRGMWRLDEPTIHGKPFEDTPSRDDEGPPEKNKIDAPYDCGNCAVDVYCDGEGRKVKQEDGKLTDQNCSGGFAMTFPKDETNVIPICLPKFDSINYYLLFHELVRAQQFCNLPANAMEEAMENVELCCAVEQPAHFSECSAVAEDGNFDGTDISVEICTSILTNMSCQHLMEKGSETGACSGEQYAPKVWEKWFKKINKAMVQNRANLPTSCEEVIENMDQRIQGMINSLRLVCSPECEAKYENTIGNNACYIAQCVEESLETQRILPGRMTFISPEQTFPWDSETKPDPLIGSIMPIPPLPNTRLPKYRPELLAKELDLALCQLNGLPLKSPPHECSFNVMRQLSLQPEIPVLLGAGLVGQTAEQFEAAWILQSTAPGIGSRIGTRIFGEYLDRAGRAFEEIIRSANHLVGSIANTEFPKHMCPRTGDPKK